MNPNTNTDDLCRTCPIRYQVETHASKIATVEADLKIVRDFMIESKMLRQLTLGGGFLSVITLFMTIVNLALSKP